MSCPGFTHLNEPWILTWCPILNLLTSKTNSHTKDDDGREEASATDGRRQMLSNDFRAGSHDASQHVLLLAYRREAAKALVRRALTHRGQSNVL